jgi:hypothetical protein
LLLYGFEFASHVDWEVVIARRADEYDLQVLRSKGNAGNPYLDCIISPKA